MIDIKKIREKPEIIENLLKRKDPSIDLKPLVELDEKIRQLKSRNEELKFQRNQLSKEIGMLKREGKGATKEMDAVAAISEEAHALDHALKPLEEHFIDQISRLPNLPFEDIKVSMDPADNVIIKESGKKRAFAFPYKNHLELNEIHQLFDFERGARLAGSGWPIYKGWGARLEWALISYMLSVNIKNGFMQWIPPLLVRKEAMYGAGQLPKFDNQQFKVDDEEYHLYLIPTAEVPLNSMHADEILEREILPLQYCAYTPCFRREAGAAGTSERGLIRTHQFNKVEMFAFTHPEKSNEMFDKMVASAEEILTGLELHYRLAELVTGDMSFAAQKTVDVEVWLPGQDRYYEVSSISNCGDYQARRSQIRFREKTGEKPELVHTLNGSGLATSRLMVSLLENHQNEDGSIHIPKVLSPYLDGIAKIV